MLHLTATHDATGEVLSEETILCDVDVVQKIEKGFSVLGSDITLAFEFDPPQLVENYEPTTD